MNMTIQKIPPQNIDAEQSILASCLLKDASIVKVVNEIKHDDFYSPAHRDIFSAMVELFNDGTAIDLVTISSQLKSNEKLDSVGGVAYLVKLSSEIIAPTNIIPYCRIVKDKSKARDLIRISNEVISDCYDGATGTSEIINSLGNSFFNVAADNSNKAVPVKEICGDVLSDIEEQYKSEYGVVGLPSGLSDLDKILHGFAPSKFYLLAARPSMGKTTLALNIMQNASVEGYSSLFFSLEMDKKEIVLNQISAISRIDSDNLRVGNLRDGDWPKLTRAVGQLKESKVIIDDTPSLSITQIRARARMVANQHKISAIFVDYLQLATASEKNREREISVISAGLKAMCKELNVPVIALSQLSRKCEERTDKKPMLSDLRDSGSLEQDADVCMFIYCDDKYNTSEDNPKKGIAEILIRKNRTGPTGYCKLFFMRENATFQNYSNTTDR
jgi:replicative DNA helicase